MQRYQPGAGWGSTDEDHLLPEDRAPLSDSSGLHAIDDLDDIEPSSLGGTGVGGYLWECLGGDGDAAKNVLKLDEEEEEEGWSVGEWAYAEDFDMVKVGPAPPLLLKQPAKGGGSTPLALPPSSSKPVRAGVRSRLWWRVMIPDDGGAAAKASRSRASSGRMSRGGSRRESAACGRRKVPHAVLNSNYSSETGVSGGGGKGGGGDRVRVPLERLKRAAVVGPNTLIVELEIEGLGGRWWPATLVVGPCDAARLGSLLVERVAMAAPRVALGKVIRKARELADAPPPLPPRPSVKGMGGGGGTGASVGEFGGRGRGWARGGGGWCWRCWC